MLKKNLKENLLKTRHCNQSTSEWVQSINQQTNKLNDISVAQDGSDSEEGEGEDGKRKKKKKKGKKKKKIKVRLGRF